MSILWTIIIGFVAGVIAKLLHPGNKYEPSGFIVTTVPGIVELSSQHTLARQSGGIKLARARVSLEQSLAQS
jgi:uncharacterized membrane protein YeaQ/YmgE (transglycosylase-associated protein family)